jgi:hypothetical protein
MSLTQQQKDAIQRLWSENFLNFKETARETIRRDNRTAYIAISVEDSVFKSKSQEVYPHALQALQALSDSKRLKFIVWNNMAIRDFDFYSNNFLKPRGIGYDFYNENPDMMVIGNDPRKPFYDILIDVKAGFKPENSWFWIGQLFSALDRMIPEPDNTIQPIATPNPFDTRFYQNIPVAKPVEPQYPVAKPISGAIHRGTDKYHCKPDNSLTNTRIKRRVGREPERIFNPQTGIWEDKK